MCEFLGIAGLLMTTTLISLTVFALVLPKVPLIDRLLKSRLTMGMCVRAWRHYVITQPQMRRENADAYLVRVRKAAA